MTINVSIKVKQWKDKASGSWIIHYKKGDLCAYGQTKKKARRMFLTHLDNILWDSMSEKQKQYVSPSYKRSSLKLQRKLAKK